MAKDIKIRWPWAALAGVILLMLVVLHLLGRSWFCTCGELRLWISDPRSLHTSQHLLDPYSFTHLQHGLVFFWMITWLFPKWRFPWQVWLALTLEAGWEILENSPMIINRYRTTTAALGYTGDSILNSLGDLFACWAGFMLARKIGKRSYVELFFAIEAILLITIRDSLLLNVLMLSVDIPWLKAWQQG